MANHQSNISALVSIAIMGVPTRLDNIKLLQEQLAEFSPLLFIDSQYKGCWWNARRAWLSAHRPYHLVLQDDVKLCPNFQEHLQQILQLLPNHIISFFQSGFIFKHIHDVISTGNHWVCANRVRTAQGILMPKALSTQFLLWISKRIPDRPDYNKRFHDDQRIGLWQMLTDMPVYIPVPELITHLGYNSSTLDYHFRKPFDNFLSTTQSIDWTAGLTSAEQNKIIFRKERIYYAIQRD